PWLEPYVFVRERDVMDPQVVQAFAALLAGAGATQQPQPSWLQQLAAAAAAGTQTSSASSASSFGYPGTGLFASQSATDAAQMYGYMMQLAEQAKLVASAEAQSASPVPSPRSEEELRNKVREVLRSELAPGNVKAPPLKQTQDPKASDPQDAPAEADPEQALDQARREYEAERQKEGHEVDKKAIRFAKDFYDRGILEVFARFKPAPPEEEQKPDKPDKPVAEPAVKKNAPKEKPTVVDLVQDNRERLVGKKKPREPPYPPKGMEKKSDKKEGPYPNINPPPPAVDIMKDGKRTLRCIRAVHSLPCFMFDL
ncbi:unnamed protein product, partial [Symbiodinium pilosum]